MREAIWGFYKVLVVEDSQSFEKCVEKLVYCSIPHLWEVIESHTSSPFSMVTASE